MEWPRQAGDLDQVDPSVRRYIMGTRVLLWFMLGSAAGICIGAILLELANVGHPTEALFYSFFILALFWPYLINVPVYRNGGISLRQNTLHVCTLRGQVKVDLDKVSHIWATPMLPIPLGGLGPVAARLSGGGTNSVWLWWFGPQAGFGAQAQNLLGPLVADLACRPRVRASATTKIVLGVDRDRSPWRKIGRWVLASVWPILWFGGLFVAFFTLLSQSDPSF